MAGHIRGQFWSVDCPCPSISFFLCMAQHREIFLAQHREIFLAQQRERDRWRFTGVDRWSWDPRSGPHLVSKCTSRWRTPMVHGVGVSEGAGCRDRKVKGSEIERLRGGRKEGACVGGGSRSERGGGRGQSERERRRERDSIYSVCVRERQKYRQTYRHAERESVPLRTQAS